jgi:nucleotide-binding universal stress UspA family protein
MKIICAVDGSAFSEWGVQFLEALAGRPPETVTLIYVVQTPSMKATAAKKTLTWKRVTSALDKAGAEVLRRLEGATKVGLAQAITKPHTKIRTVLAHGSIAATITKEARRRKADLIVLGSRGLSNVQGFLLGSVSRKVSALAPCPVLVVKRPLTKLGHVLLAVDASKHSRAAAGFLSKEFLPETARVTVLSIIDPLMTELAARYVPVSQLEELTKQKRDMARQLVSQFRDLFLKEGYAVTSEVATDHVADSILKYAAQSNADLLVAGSRGLTSSERLQLGSVSETLLKYAGCSVLIVRGWRA